MVVFRGHYYHRPTSFFGKTAQDGRLFQTFFFCAANFGDCAEIRKLEQEMRQSQPSDLDLSSGTRAF